MNRSWLLALVVACAPRHASFVKVDEVALGRVVIYRNGVAYYERRATVEGGVLTVSVPRNRVDDFLKSLTVVDAVSHQPLPVSIPRHQDDGASLVMKLQLPTRNKADVVLTYVTESPAWKPSYRVVVGDKGKVMLEGWAVVDNTSGEDWKGVIVGVGSSSALSFKYDLWSVRQVQRETLADEAKFAVAPPNGVSPAEVHEDQVVAEFGDMRPSSKSGWKLDGEYWRDELGYYRFKTKDPAVRHRKLEEARQKREQAERRKSVSISEEMKNNPLARDEEAPPDPFGAIDITGNQTIVIESTSTDADTARDQAKIVQDQLIDRGVAAKRIAVTTKVVPNKEPHVRLIAKEPKAAPPVAEDATAAPVGETHFSSTTPMTIERGASAMVSMVRDETDGEVVYLYDAESARGNEHFAFRAVRFRNPTASTLETGPVTVYGNERFIGEGLTEPIAPHASAVVPYALDRQVVVEREDNEQDRVAKLVTIERGMLTAQVQHVKRRKLAITNRLEVPAKVFIRHTIEKGWTLVDAPKTFERVGDAHLFYIELAPHAVTHVEIATATPLEQTLDLGADATLEMMKVYVEAPDGAPALKEQLRKLLAVHKTLADLTTEQESQRRRLADYKERMDELHAQLVSLQAVKSGADLISHLTGKMKDISNRVQKATIGIVDQEEKIMLAKVRFQDLIADLALPDAMATR